MTTETPHTLGAFRECPHGDAIAYRATLEASGPEAVSAIITSLERGYYLHRESHPGRYAVLNILNDNGQMIDTRDIPDVIAFDKMRESLGLRVTSTDCDYGCR